jgi:hypothetical protein
MSIMVSPWWDEGFTAPDGARNPYDPGTMSYIDWNMGLIASGRQPKPRRHPCPMDCLRLAEILDRMVKYNEFWVSWRIDEEGRVLITWANSGESCIWTFSKEFRNRYF